jgi:ParB-like chromosome segregation protein Spo0J
MNTKIAEGIKNQPLLKIDQELEKCLPPLPLDQWEDLKESISKGYDPAKPIVLWKERPTTIVDGHHRYKACLETGISPITIEKSFESIDVAVLYALHRQIEQRNLTPAQMVIVYEQIIPLEDEQRFQDEAKKAREERNRDKSGLFKANAPESTRRVDTGTVAEVAQKIANRAGVSKSTVYAVHQAQKNGVPELSSLLASGEVSAKAARVFVSNVPEKEKQSDLISKGGSRAVNDIASEHERATTLAREQKARAAAAKSGFEEHTKVREDLEKKHNEMATQLGKRFGEDFETQGRVCFVEFGNTLELWCADCQRGFDTFTGGKDAEFCPYCGLKNIRTRNPGWIPGSAEEDE